MKTLLIALLIPLSLQALEPVGKKLNLKLAPKADDDTRKLQKQSKEAASPIPKEAQIAVDCTDTAGITHKPGDAGWQKCTDAMPTGTMNGSNRRYEGPTKNTVNPTTRTTQSEEAKPSVQVR